MAKERLVDQAYRRSDSERRRLDAAEEKERKRRGEEAMKEGWSLSENKKLTRNYIENVRPDISDNDYKSLLKSLRGGIETDDSNTVHQYLGLVFKDPDAALSLAYNAHHQGRLTDATARSFINEARSISRTEGPKSPYENERAFIVDMLTPSPFATDPAPRARMGLAVQEFDDFNKTGVKTSLELREKPIR